MSPVKRCMAPAHETGLTAGFRLTVDGRLSELLAPNRPARYAFQRQQSGVDFVYLSTRHRPLDYLISNQPQLAHSVSYLGATIGLPTQEVCHANEPSAVSTGAFVA